MQSFGKTYMQPAAEPSFWDKAWSAIKWVGGALLALTGISLLFSKSDAAKDMLDKFTGGAGKGAGTYLRDKGNKLSDAISNFFKEKPPEGRIPNLKPGDVAVTLKVGDTTFFAGTSEAAQTFKDVDQTRMAMLPNIKAELKQAAELPHREESEKSLQSLKELQNDALKFAKTAEVWDKAVDVYVKENPTAKTPPKFEIFKKPFAINPDLEKFGTHVDKDWGKKSALDKISALSERFNASVMSGEKAKVEAELAKVKTPAGLIDKIGDWSYNNLGISGYTNQRDNLNAKAESAQGPESLLFKAAATAADAKATGVITAAATSLSLMSPLGPIAALAGAGNPSPHTLETITKSRLSNMLAEGNLDAAGKLAAGMHNYFNEQAKKHPDQNDTLKSVANDFKNVVEYADKAQKQKSFEDLREKTYAAIKEASLKAPSVNAYIERTEQAAKNAAAAEANKEKAVTGKKTSFDDLGARQEALLRMQNARDGVLSPTQQPSADVTVQSLLPKGNSLEGPQLVS